MQDEQAIRDFLGDRPESGELRTWRETLEGRLAAMRKELDRTGNEALKPKMDQLRKQIRALAEEEAVTEFVEDSVRVTLAMGAVADGMDDLEP